MTKEKILVNEALLTQEQVAKYGAWKEFFASPGWKMYQEYFAPRFHTARNALLDAVGEQSVGYLQGQAAVLTLLLAHAEDLIAGEFLALSGQLDQPDEPDPAQGPKDWNA